MRRTTFKLKPFAEFVIERLSLRERSELLKKYKSRYGSPFYNERGLVLLQKLKECVNQSHLRDCYLEGLERMYPGLTIAEIEEFLTFKKEDKPIEREFNRVYKNLIGKG